MSTADDIPVLGNVYEGDPDELFKPDGSTDEPAVEAVPEDLSDVDIGTNTDPVVVFGSD